MKLIIFRHGRSATNGITIQGGGGDAPLTEEGIKQAQELRDKLKKEKIKTIFSSPLQRAQKTAEIVGETYNSDIITLENLRETSLGKCEGIPRKDFEAKFQSAYGNILDPRDPNYMSSKVEEGESRAEVLVRWLEAEKNITYSFNKKEKVVGIATHGDLMSVVYYHYYSIPNYEFDNCEYFEIHLEYKGE